MTEPAFTSVSIDTRQLSPGALFVALRAARDGHAWIETALQDGAGGLLVDRRGYRTAKLATAPVPVITAEDTGAALLALGGAARDRLTATVVGITGSVGKTSTKDLAAAALGAELCTTASEKSFNNELGVPLTLANARPETQAAVIEMGARGPGHVARLCEVARPSIGVVTSVAAAHTEAFGDLDAVAAAKAELVIALPSDGTAVLNGDDRRVSAMAAKTDATVLRYSVRRDGPASPTADVVADSVVLDGELRPRFVVRSPWGAATVRLEARGAHQVGNALAALDGRPVQRGRARAGRPGVGNRGDVAVAHGAALFAYRGSHPQRRVQRQPRVHASRPRGPGCASRPQTDGRPRRDGGTGPTKPIRARGHCHTRRPAGSRAAGRGHGRLWGAASEGHRRGDSRPGHHRSGDAVLVKASRVAGLERLAARLYGRAPGQAGS